MIVKSFILNIILLLLCLNLSGQDTWVKLQDFSGPRSLGASFCIGNKVYFGQGSAGGANTINDFWEFDILSQTWKTINTIPGNALIGATAFSYKNFGFIGLGQSGPSTFSRAFYRYVVDSNVWIRIADFPGSSRNYAACFIIGNKAYIGCGYNGFQTFKDFYSLNLDSNTWTKISDLPGLPRSKPFYFASKENGYVLCGNNYSQSSGDNLLKDFYKYNPTTNTWLQNDDFPGENREGGVSFSFESGGIVALGLSVIGYSNEVWEYNSNTQTWTNRNSFQNAPRRNTGFCSVNNKGFMIGGNLGSSFSSETFEYRPISTAIKSVNYSQQIPKIYPNPFKDCFNVSLLNQKYDHLIEIFDLKGNCLFKTYQNKEEICCDLQLGCYLLKISELKNSTSYFKIIIKN